MVQWSSARVCKPSVPGSDLRYLLTTFHSLISPPSGQKLPKLLLYCPQTERTKFICIWGYSSEKPTPNNMRVKSICTSISLMAPTVNDVEKKCVVFGHSVVISIDEKWPANIGGLNPGLLVVIPERWPLHHRLVKHALRRALWKIRAWERLLWKLTLAFPLVKNNFVQLSRLSWISCLTSY